MNDKSLSYLFYVSTWSTTYLKYTCPRQIYEYIKDTATRDFYSVECIMRKILANFHSLLLILRNHSYVPEQTASLPRFAVLNPKRRACKLLLSYRYLLLFDVPLFTVSYFLDGPLLCAVAIQNLTRIQFSLPCWQIQLLCSESDSI